MNYKHKNPSIRVATNALTLALVTTPLSACDLSDTYSHQEKTTTETQKALSTFHQQKHRFEFNGCTNQYNGKKFKLGMTVQDLITVLGTPSKEKTINTKSNNLYYWLDDVVKVYEDKSSKKINVISIDLRKISDNNRDMYFLIEGIPLNKNMTMGQFVDFSNYDFHDFYVGRSSYKLIHEECKKPISYYFSSNVSFDYIGDGHARIKGDPNFENTSPVDALEISFHEN